MAINFPNSPTLNQISQVGDNFYIWNGSAWIGYTTSFVNNNVLSVVVQDDGVVSGATTTLNFGSNISVAYSSGIATITGAASGTPSQWVTTGVGIHTLSNVGIGTTNPQGTLQVGTGITMYGSTGIVSATAFYGDGSNLTKPSRTVVSGTTSSVGIGSSATLNITGFKSYTLLKVGISSAGWLRLYTDSTTRTNDINRAQGVDPSPDAGVIAEIISTGSTTVLMSPGVIGWNNDATPSTTIYARVNNTGLSSHAYTVDLTVVKMEG